MQTQIDAGKQHQPRLTPASRGSNSAEGAPLHPILQLQQQAGNQAVQALLRTGSIQLKSAISNPDDPEEREAEEVAHQIMRSPAAFPASHCSCAAGEEMCDECQQKQSSTAILRSASPHSASAPHLSAAPHPTPAPHSTPSQIPRIVTDVLRSPGHPLDPATRAFFEPRFGQDFSHVRVHTGPEASASARSISAHAYTAGSNIVFAPGQYAPETENGRHLLAHELAHTLQQSPSGELYRDDGDADTADSGSDSDGVKGDWDVFDPNDPWKAIGFWVEQIDKDDEVGIDRVAFNERFLLLLLKTGASNWSEWLEFDEFRVGCETVAADEKLTLEALGDKTLENEDTEVLPATSLPGHQQSESVPEAFPVTWSEKLARHLFLSYPSYLVRRDIEAGQKLLDESGNAIPPYVHDHGLPLSYPESLTVEHFYMVSAVGVGVLWTAPPVGIPDQDSPVLREFVQRAWNYLRSLNDLDLINDWTQAAQTVIQQIHDGELSVDPIAFAQYQKLRPEGAGVPFDVIQSGSAASLQPLSGKIDPAVAEAFVTGISRLNAFLQSISHAEDIAAIGNRFMEAANQSVANENPFRRVALAHEWGSEHGFYSDALLQQWEGLKEHAWEIAGGVAKDAVKYGVLQLIPVVDVIADLYLLGQTALDAADSISKLADADEEARNAKTAAQLQHAAAKQAEATSDAAAKVAMAIAAYGAAKLGGKAVDKILGGENKAGVPDEEPRPADEKAKERETGPPDENASEAEVASRQVKDPELIKEKAIVEDEIKTPDNIEDVLDPDLRETYDYQVEVEGTEKHTYYHKKATKGRWCRASGTPICGYAFGPEVEEALETARQARRPSRTGKETEKRAEEFFGNRFQRQERSFEGDILGKGKRSKYGMSIADLATKDGPRVVVEIKNIDIKVNLRTQFRDLLGQVSKYLSNVPGPEQTKFWVWLDIRGQKLPPGGLLEIVESVTEGTGHVFDQVYLDTEVGTLVYRT
jgi:uncharacterized protein DUF4157